MSMPISGSLAAVLKSLKITSQLGNIRLGQSVKTVLSTTTTTAVLLRKFHEDFLNKRITAQTEKNPFKEPDAGELSKDLEREIGKREVRKKKAVIERKYGFKPKGARPRVLTWDAIEHIHFLRAEHAQEWSLARLADGFGVDVDVIVRVLKNKSWPVSKEKRALHDQQALANRRQFGLPALPPIPPQQRALPQGLKVKALPQTEVKTLSPVQKEMVQHLGQMRQRLQHRKQQRVVTASRTESDRIVELQNHEPQHLEELAKGTWIPQHRQSVATRKDAPVSDDGYKVENIDFDLMQESFENMMEKYPDIDEEKEVERDGQFFTKDGDFLYKV